MTTEERSTSVGETPRAAAKAGPKMPRAGMTYSVKVYLIALLLVVLVPAFLFSAVVLIRTSEAQNRAFQNLFIAATHSVAQLIDRDVSGMLATLRVLSTAPSLQSGNLAEFHGRAIQALGGTGAYLTVLDGDFDELMSTRAPYGTDLGKAADTAAPQKALATGWPVVSDLFFDINTNRWSFNVALPLKQAPGRAKVLVLTQQASNFDQALGSKQIPKGWQAALVDDTRTVIASSDGPGGTGRPFYIPFDKGLSSGFTEVLYQGVSYQLIVQPSDVTGWSIVSWAPSKEVHEAVNQSIAWLVFGGLVIAALAASGAIMIARIMSRSAENLAKDARRLGAGETVERREHAIIEFTTVSDALTRAARERKSAENEIRFLMREVAHRSKNQLTVIQAMLNQTAKLSESKDEFAEAFRRRVSGLARSTDLMISNAKQGVDLGALVADQLETFRPSDPTRVHVKGPEVRLDSQSAQVMGMAIHELSTNAAKYGAFSGLTGTLDVTWTVESEFVRFVWRERGVELEERPERKGFGSIVLERILGVSLGAELERTLHDDGIEWTFTIPLDKLRGEIEKHA
ncbi:MAG TPA: sensor histidine kinase [Pararhizobium sp.]|nr:sensor histidine kinase [Pararhizobium sp.]